MFQSSFSSLSFSYFFVVVVELLENVSLFSAMSLKKKENLRNTRNNYFFLQLHTHTHDTKNAVKYSKYFCLNLINETSKVVVWTCVCFCIVSSRVLNDVTHIHKKDFISLLERKKKKNSFATMWSWKVATRKKKC